jgi:hypothetical protein
VPSLGGDLLGMRIGFLPATARNDRAGSKFRIPTIQTESSTNQKSTTASLAAAIPSQKGAGEDRLAHDLGITATEMEGAGVAGAAWNQSQVSHDLNGLTCSCGYPAFAVRTRSLRPASAIPDGNDFHPTARDRQSANRRRLMVLQREYNPQDNARRRDRKRGFWRRSVPGLAS